MDAADPDKDHDQHPAICGHTATDDDGQIDEPPHGPRGAAQNGAEDVFGRRSSERRFGRFADVECTSK